VANRPGHSGPDLCGPPFSLQYDYQHGGFYLFSRRFLEDLPKSLTGPGRFRFILQPAVAVFLAYGLESPMRGPATALYYGHSP
jgi:hypothetical protein